MKNMWTISKNDKLANLIIIALSMVVFVAVAVLSRIKIDVKLGFDPHIFALINAIINGTVSLLLIGGLITVKQKKYNLHQRIMMSAMILSSVFLISYICHHLFTGETSFGGNGFIKIFYYFILITHIFLAAIILPFILYTAYRALTTEYTRHKKIAKYTWPIWFYVSLTGVLVYILISPYYA